MEQTVVRRHDLTKVNIKECRSKHGPDELGHRRLAVVVVDDDSVKGQKILYVITNKARNLSGNPCLEPNSVRTFPLSNNGSKELHARSTSKGKESASKASSRGKRKGRELVFSTDDRASVKRMRGRKAKFGHPSLQARKLSSNGMVLLVKDESEEIIIRLGSKVARLVNEDAELRQLGHRPPI